MGDEADATGGFSLFSASSLEERGTLQGLWWRNVLVEPPWRFGLFNLARMMVKQEDSVRIFLVWDITKIISFWTFHCGWWEMRVKLSAAQKSSSFTILSSNKTKYLGWIYLFIYSFIHCTAISGLLHHVVTPAFKTILPYCKVAATFRKCFGAPQGKHNSEEAELMLQRICSSLINISAVLSAVVVRNASCLGV